MRLIILLLLSAPVWATGDCKGQSCNGAGDVSAQSSSQASSSASAGANIEVGDTVLTGGDNTATNSAHVEGSRSYALGMPSGTIADCMAHMAVAIVSIPTRNKFCERIDFTMWAENPVRHTANSIKIRCSTKIAKDVYGSRGDCESDFSAVEPPDHHLTEIAALRRVGEALAARLAYVETELEGRVAKSEEKAKKATLEARYAVREAQKHPEKEVHPEVQQQISDYEQRRLKAKATLEGE